MSRPHRPGTDMGPAVILKPLGDLKSGLVLQESSHFRLHTVQCVADRFSVTPEFYSDSSNGQSLTIQVKHISFPRRERRADPPYEPGGILGFDQKRQRIVSLRVVRMSLSPHPPPPLRPRSAQLGDERALDADLRVEAEGHGFSLARGIVGHRRPVQGQRRDLREVLRSARSVIGGEGRQKPRHGGLCQVPVERGEGFKRLPVSRADPFGQPDDGLSRNG